MSRKEIETRLDVLRSERVDVNELDLVDVAMSHLHQSRLTCLALLQVGWRTASRLLLHSLEVGGDEVLVDSNFGRLRKLDGKTS